jgi:vitamin B12 transporter
VLAGSRTRISPLVWAILAIALVGAPRPLVAEEARHLTGTVVDAGGRPVSGAEVIVRARAASGERRALSDGEGRFTIDLPEGGVLIEARVGGARSAVRVLDAADTAASIELRVDRASWDEQVVVTAEARPQPIDEVGKAITIVGADEMRARDESSMAEALRRVAGVQVRADGGPGQLTSLRIRGLRSDASAVLIDGLRFRDVTTTQGDASPFIANLQVINVDRAEVLRGSASSLYGTNAVGGAVNLVSRVGAAQPGGDLLFEAGQLGRVRARGAFNASAASGRVLYSVAGAQLNVTRGIDGHDNARSSGAQAAATARLRPSTTLWGRMWFSSDRVDLNTSPSAFETPEGNLGSASVVPARALDPNQVERLLTGQPVDFGSATFIPGVDDPDDKRTSSFWTGAVRLAHQTSGGLSLEARYQHVGTDRTFGYGPNGVGFQPIVGSETTFTGSADTVDVLATKVLGSRLLVTAAYELEREHYDGLERELSNAPAAFRAGTAISQLGHAVSARASLTPGARAHVAASLRVQAFQLSDPRFTPNGTSSSYDGLTFDAPPTAVTGDVAASLGVGPHDTRLRAHVGNAYRAPSLYERFGGGFSANPATGVVSFTAYGDPRLEPDRYVSADAGVEQTFGRGRLRATWFHTWIQQLTEFDFSGAMNPATDPFGRFGGYVNGDGGRARGLELEADVRLASLTVTSAYTFTDSITDKALLAENFFRAPSVARHTFAVTAVGHVGEHLELVGDVFARGPIYTALFTSLGSRAYEFPGRATVDVGAAWSWRLSDRRRLRAHAKIDNLFDRRYYELGWLAPGATATAGVTLQY